MERKTRIWLGLGAAVLVGGGPVAGQPALAATGAPERALAPERNPGASLAAQPSAGLQFAQLGEHEVVREGGEGGGGEGGEGGGGGVPGEVRPLTDYRLLSTNPNAWNFDAATQVAAYGAVAQASYEAAHAEALTMQQAIEAFLADPTPESLAAARSAWAAARLAYMPTEAFRYYGGPIDGAGGPQTRLNASPIDPAFIDYVDGNPNGGLVNDGAVALTRQALAAMNQVASQAEVTTGWHVIEFLLWGEDLSASGPGDRPHADYVAGQGNNDRRREYLGVVTQLLINDLSTLVAAWAADANNYRATLALMDQRNVIGRVFNGVAILAGYEIPTARIAAALEPGDDALEHSRFGDTTTAELAAGLAGIRAVYFGSAGAASGGGFDALLAGVDPAANDRVIAALDRADAAVAALDAPFDGILASPPGSPARAEAEAAIAALQELGDALRDAGNRLGVLVLIPELP